jgi:hypothetical protein
MPPPTFDEALGRVSTIEDHLSEIWKLAEGMNKDEEKELGYAIEDVRLAFNDWLKRLEKKAA